MQPTILLAALAVAAQMPVRRVEAGCNIIPPAVRVFPSTLANIDRPFAGPGDVVTLSLDAVCHAASPGFVGTTADQVVSVIFTPPDGGPANVVALSTNCGAVDTASCAALAGVDTATCLTVNAPGQPLSIERLDPRILRVRFPDTDAQVRAANDDLTYSGSAVIAVTGLGDSLPCALATTPCSGVSGLRACVDAFYASDSTCNTTPAGTFSHFTALPPPNDYQALCTNPVPPCTGLIDDVRFTVDADGNLLLPMDWRGVRPDQDRVPVARLLQASSSVEAYEGRGAPVLIPDLTVLASYSPEGIKLPPLFDPQHDPADTASATFFGTTDAVQTVLRIARHQATYNQCALGPNDGLPCINILQCTGGSCAGSRCVGGGNAGSACTTDGNCPGGECGPGLFDFSTRLVDQVGPVLIRLGACIGGGNALGSCSSDAQCPGGQCGTFAVAALDPVPLDGLNQSSDLSAFVMEEAIPNPAVDLNGDNDMTDHVVKLVDRTTGILTPIGAGGSDGRAVVRIHQPPFSFPAVALENDVLAFLQPEPDQGGVSVNADGDANDLILEAFRLDGTELSNPAQPVTADGAPVINGRSLLLSNGRLFFRTAERDEVQFTVERISLDSLGNEVAEQSTCSPDALSTDGRYVVFGSVAHLLPADTDNAQDVYLYDRQTGTLELISDPPTVNANNNAYPDGVTPDGRYVVFGQFFDDPPYYSGNVFVRDRIADTTTRASVSFDGTPQDTGAGYASISADGRLVSFASYSSAFVASDTIVGTGDVFLRDLLTSTTSIAALNSAGKQATGSSNDLSRMTGDGRFFSFRNNYPGRPYKPMIPGDSNATQDIVIHDRLLGINERVNVGTNGEEANGPSNSSGMSADGNVVAFDSAATNLVPGIDAGTFSYRTYVRDRRAGTTERIGSGTSPLDAPSLSADGRYVNYSDEVGFNILGVLQRDRITGISRLVSATYNAAPLEISAVNSAMSADGLIAAFYSQSSNLVPGDTNNGADVFVSAPDPLDTAADLTGDGDHNDTLLRVLDTTGGAPGTLIDLCPATQVAVADGGVAFLRPEAAGPSPGCPAGPSFNGDADTDDAVVHVWNGASVQNLGRAATAVARSADWIAALVSESGEPGPSLNGDGDDLDSVVQVHPASGGGWTNVGLAGDSLDMSGGLAVFLTPEHDENNTDLNGDGDTDDRVLHVYDADVVGLTNVGQAAEEFVAGSSGLVAFRTLESAQQAQLNGDGDESDGVLQVYDAGAQLVINSHMAVTPCRLEACDPRTPYRVLNDTITFLTLEADQGEDLNEDGDLQDVVVQVLNARKACNDGSIVGACHALASVPAGICTDTARACASDESCPNGTCFTPPGGCTLDVGTACVPGVPGSCASGQYCEPEFGNPGNGSCREVVGPCAGQADCADPAVCYQSDQTFNRLAGPLGRQNAGAAVFTGAGRCVENLGTACAQSTDCEPGEYCASGTCRREQGVCAKDADCPAGATCAQDLLRQTAEDSDGDELPDAIDNCPQTANILQQDADNDGIGDVCDAEACTGITDGKARITLNARTGKLVAKFRVPLALYAGESVTVTLSDKDGAFASTTLASLPPHGGSGRKWQYDSAAAGLQKVAFKAPASAPGTVQVKLKAKGWFTPAQANRVAGNTILTLRIGTACFHHAVTKKID